MNNELVAKACNWARNKHLETNHLYDGKPYEIHLWQVVDVAKMFLHYVADDCKDIVLAACWLHDTIEDCRVTYNDLSKEFGEGVANIVYALTNEKGKSRAERANDKYYSGIQKTPYAAFVKLCDRIANIKYSLESKSGMYDKYKNESENFKEKLGRTSYAAMWDYMDSLLNTN